MLDKTTVKRAQKNKKYLKEINKYDNINVY